jgi:hypothetical protein
MPSVTAISCDQTWSGVICSIDNWIIRNKSNEEALSFCATILLAAVGWAALMVAFGQSNHAKKARLADTLIGLSKSLDAILPLQDSVDACLSALNANTMEEQKKAIVGVWDGTITYPFREDVIDSIDTLLAFFEDVGQLCRRGYVSQKDIFDLMGATLLLTLEQSLEYIENVRQVNDRNTYYSNVLWIYRRARSAPRFAVYGHGLQVPRLRTRLLASVRYRFSFLGL